MITLNVKLLQPGAQAPKKMTVGSAGYDLFASKSTTIPAARHLGNGLVEIGRSLVSTGIALELPPGTVGRVAARSGLSVKFNIEVGAGWIDGDYRGEIMVELKNLSAEVFVVDQGDRIAQLLLLPITDAEVNVVPKLSESSRDIGGFGSTGP